MVLFLRNINNSGQIGVIPRGGIGLLNRIGRSAISLNAENYTRFKVLNLIFAHFVSVKCFCFKAIKSICKKRIVYCFNLIRCGLSQRLFVHIYSYIYIKLIIIVLYTNIIKLKKNLFAFVKLKKKILLKVIF